ncbi:uncharacterized protein I206_104444 [Kwoniella pini CBS 10737]|uniref:Palmitoyl-protein thioesterase 1 n=1 Tax=Kwoniella pini CBS 10737 TaxID=1296096 RepID=A0A1B9I1Q3_9TREE|nr:palmitoyl-protein thioesterase [Kwoniella pini CBS 10737]OCF49454.1 palmitoyl-protein thioesterase [Kwoniella pini CBS 10737]
MKGTSHTRLVAIISIVSAVLAVPTSDQHIFESKKPRPLVIWHGLGDTALSSGILSFIEDIKSVHEGIFVHSIQIPLDGSLDDERRAGFWGNAEEQGWEGCEQIENIPELKGGFDAMGFSQGGLFLRFYAQYCNNPPIKNLITFGTPHFGISALIPCPTPPTLSCLLAAKVARSGIYSNYAQSHIIQAAYFRDTERLKEFYQINSFIRDLNGEKCLGNDLLLKLEEEENKKKGKNGSGLGVSNLNNFIAIMFDQDRTVSPAQSSQFSTYSSKNKTLIIPMKEQLMYKQDWIGLKKLNEKGGLKLEHCPGEHMDLGGKGGCGDQVVKDWVGWRE